QLFDLVDQENHIDTILFLRQLQQHPLSDLGRFDQRWLRPIVDYSLPPDLAYDTIPAWQLLETDINLDRYAFDQQIVIVASGGYAQAGVTPGADNFTPPLAVYYWRSRFNLAPHNRDRFTGSEANAYMIHHLLTKRLVIPIPD
ncbi:MAG: histidine kinase, partial [Phototrophicales bacterium]